MIHEEPIRCALAKRRKTTQDSEDSENGATENKVVVSITQCAPPTKSAISQLVGETIATFATPPPAVGSSANSHRKAFSFSPIANALLSPKALEDKLARAQSESAMTIKMAVERINSNPTLVGDGSNVHILPFMEYGKHSDLKEINGASLIELIDGKYSSDVAFEIVDCRYPYEFNGGHIKGAVNLHTKRQVYDRFFGAKVLKNKDKEKREIMVFHCEFSSQRGPEMCRYLRDCDRRLNEYPSLHYPELYVLFGGYKLFYEQFISHCIPQQYLPMIHEKYVEEYRYYKTLTKVEGSAVKKQSTRSDGKGFRAASMKKLCMDNL